ncbi:MAG: kelch repeat-containing protein [Spirochaetota bacterium]
MKKAIGFLYLFVTLLSCGDTPVSGGTDNDNLRFEWVSVSNITQTTANILWKCSSDTNGYLTFGNETTDFLNISLGLENYRLSLLEGEYHNIQLTHLTAGQAYNFIVFCGEPGGTRASIIERFVTQEITYPSIPKETPFLTSINGERGIWLFGGIGSDSSPVAEVDVYDPVDDTWHSAVTSLPTPRAYSTVITHNSKIYVMGGMTKSSGVWTASSVVEEYTPESNTWQTKTAMPSNLQGAIGISVGDEIYLVSGTTTTDMTTGTVLNTVLRYQPSNDTWISYTSQSSIYSRVDMAGCGIDGVLFFTGGRLYNDGNAYATSDAYLPAGNTTTSVNEASISQARHGAGYACYNPLSTDTNSTDSPGMIVVGGSTTANFTQPVSAITPSNTYEYYLTGTTTNSFSTGPTLPASVYYPAVNISYQTRKAYVFGGATQINLPSTTVYAIGMASPTAGPWETLTTVMPRARFAHKAVLLDR